MGTRRRGIGQIKGVVIRNYTAYEPAPNASTITGTSEHEIDVLFKNLHIAGQLRTGTDEADIKIENADVTFFSDD